MLRRVGKERVRGRQRARRERRHPARQSQPVGVELGPSEAGACVREHRAADARLEERDGREQDAGIGLDPAQIDVLDVQTGEAIEQGRGRGTEATLVDDRGVARGSNASAVSAVPAPTGASPAGSGTGSDRG